MSSSAFSTYLPDTLPSLTQEALDAAEQASCAANDGAQSTQGDVRPLSITAYAPNGAPYEGDLILDIVNYRELRHFDLHHHLEATQQDRLSTLEKKLRGLQQISGPAKLRAFYRYDCQFDAQLLLPLEEHPQMQSPPAEVKTMSVQISDISAGGLKVEAAHQLKLGCLAFVVIPNPPQSITFQARVAWVSGDKFGLMFAGAAQLSIEAAQEQAQITDPISPEPPSKA